MIVCEKLKAIVWKNYALRKQNKVLTILEIAAPVLFYFFQPINFNGENHKLHETYPECSTDNILQLLDNNLPIYYYPNMDIIDTVMGEVVNILNLPSDTAMFVEPEELSDKFGINKYIVFIRFEFSNAYILYNIQLLSRFVKTDAYCCDFFLPLEIAIGTAYLKRITNTTIKFSMKQFPQLKYGTVIPSWFALVYSTSTAVTYVFLCLNVIHHIVADKRSGIKEKIKRMGMPSLLIWVGWFVYAFMVSIISVFVCTICVKVPLWNQTTPVLKYSSAIIFFLFLCTYIIAAVSFCFAVSSFCTNLLLADALAVFVWISSYFYPLYVLNSFDKILCKPKLHYLMFPNIALYFGFVIIQALEERKIGIHLNNLNESLPEKLNDITMASVFIMFITSIIVYLVIAWYFQHVFTGPYGISESFFFIFENAYFAIFPKKATTVKSKSGSNSLLQRVYKIENVHTLSVGISIRNVCKNFDKVRALNNVSLDIYKGQITGLLGRNGSGKTTMISIITGMIKASSGEVTIFDSNIRPKLFTKCVQLSFYLQNNVLLPQLSVIEQLTFFGILKGSSSKNAYAEAWSLLYRFNISDKKHGRVSQLSTGEKRKLLICMAIIGNPEVLLLDEPTAGLDPDSCCEMWDILLSLKKSAVIVFSTQNMEEADLLCDRIAILNDGYLICYGTPDFLRQAYDAKYYFVITFNKTGKSKSHTELITAVQQIAPLANLLWDCEDELSFFLSINSQQFFPTLLNTLENRIDYFRISKMKVSVSTMEEVYLRINDIILKERSVFLSNENPRDDIFDVRTTHVTGRKKIISQILVSFKKRFWVEKKNWKSVIFKMVYVTVLTVLSICSIDARLTSNFRVIEDLKYENSIVIQNSTSYAKIFVDSYKQLLNKFSYKLENARNVNTGIISKDLDSIAVYHCQLYMGSEFNLTNEILQVTAIYSDNRVASWSFRFALNAVLQTFCAYEAYLMSSYHMTKHCFNRVYGWYIPFIFGLLCYSATYLSFPINERFNNLKQLQILSGIHPSLYWSVCFIWDFGLFLILMAIISLVINMYGFQDVIKIESFWFTMIGYGCSSILLSYVYSHICGNHNGTFKYFLINLFLGIPVPTLVLSLKNLYANNFLYEFLNFFPSYGLAMAIYYIDQQDKRKYSTNSYSLSEQNLKITNISLYLSILLYLFILTMLEKRLLKKWKKKLSNLLQKSGLRNLHRGNRIVALETQTNINNVEEEEPKNGTFISQNITKLFTDEHVIGPINIELKLGECLGILGVNQSGKTTIFQSLTGGCSLTNGKAWMYYDNRLIYYLSYLKQYFTVVGYCLESDALNTSLTGPQLLYFFAKIRGVSEGIDALVAQWIIDLDLELYSDMIYKEYDTGSKRKLDVGISLIGSPLIVMLDEPTKGLDPESCRNLWNIINLFLKHTQACVIMGTQKFNDCEALCHKVAVLKNGRLEHLNDTNGKYQSGYVVKFKLCSPKKYYLNENTSNEEYQYISSTATLFQEKWEEKVAHLTNEIALIYKGFFVLKTKRYNLLLYHIQDSSKKWSTIYEEIEQLQDRHTIIENYEISNSCLEFVSLK